MFSDADILAEAGHMRVFNVRLPERTRAAMEEEAKRLSAKLGVRVAASTVARVALVHAMKQIAKQGREDAAGLSGTTRSAAPPAISIRRRQRPLSRTPQSPGLASPSPTSG